MHFLHLDKDFTPFGKSIAYEAFIFNGGEPHIRIIEELHTGAAFLKSNENKIEVMITTRLSSFNDLGKLLVAADALQRLGVQKMQLFCPYFPGARQDRVAVKGEPLTVKVYADIINSIGFDQVIVADPHSDVVAALVENIHVLNNHFFVREVLTEKENYVVIAPDSGALKKVYSLARFLGTADIVECKKVRDVKTGLLSGFEVFDSDLKGQPCVIIDDICDGGGTFLGLAKELKSKNAGDLNLIVTHGIFSKGLNALKEVFTNIYCTDSFSSLQEEGLAQYKWEDLLDKIS